MRVNVRAVASWDGEGRPEFTALTLVGLRGGGGTGGLPAFAAESRGESSRLMRPERGEFITAGEQSQVFFLAGSLTAR